MDRIIIQIGQVLLGNGWVDEASLERALAEQAHTGLRLCSLLIARGLLEVDLAARALGEQQAMPAALQRHVEGRDRAIAQRLPAELGRTYVALPIGETRNGQMIICVRDPRPEILGPLVQAVGCDVVMAIYPAQLLETLVAEVYGPKNEFEVDLSTNPFEVVDPRIKGRADSEPGMNFASMTLVELDDVRVAKDPSQSGAFVLPRSNTPSTPPLDEPLHPPTVSRTMTPLPPKALTPPIIRFTTTPPITKLGAPPLRRPATTPPPTKPATTPPPMTTMPAKRPTMPPPVKSPTTPPPLHAALPVALQTDELEPDKIDTDADEVAAPRFPRAASSLELDLPSLEAGLEELEYATGRDEATEIAMELARTRWTSALLLEIIEGVARGYRGHGPQLTSELIRAVTVPMSADSIIREAHDLRRLVVEPATSDGAIQDRLSRLFGRPTAAMPLIVSGHVTSVLVVGEPIDGGDAAADLGRLGAALAAAYQRLVGDQLRP